MLKKQTFIPTSSQRIKLKNSDLELCPVSLPEDYAKEWNVRLTDFLALTKGVELISNTYYRRGGLFSDRGYDFIHLIKYTESYYDKDLTEQTKKDPSVRKHLKGNFCLINKQGVETKIFGDFESSYLLCNSVYSCDAGYFNSFTNELYCKEGKILRSKNYLFIKNQGWNVPEEEEGVYKIDKTTGEFEIIN